MSQKFITVNMTIQTLHSIKMIDQMQQWTILIFTSEVEVAFQASILLLVNIGNPTLEHNEIQI